MQLTLTIDDRLLAEAMAMAEPGIDPSELIRQCIHAFIQRHAAQQLAALGGQAPDMAIPPRRREDLPDA